MKKKKEFCPSKHENHEQFYKEHPEYRTTFWKEYFRSIDANASSKG